MTAAHDLVSVWDIVILIRMSAIVAPLASISLGPIPGSACEHPTESRST